MIAIKSIKKIQDFASFENFDSSIKPYKDFQKYNLFYGLNGCGKTTLSRLMDFLNIGKIPDEDEDSKEQYQDFYNLKFKLELDDNSNIDTFIKNPLVGKVRVFNSDFVKRNVKLEKATAKSLIYNIGEKSEKLKTKKKELKSSISCWYDKNDNLILDNKKKENNNALDNKYSDLAKQIRTHLGFQPQSYKKDKVENKFNGTIENLTFSEEEIQNLANISKQEDKFELGIGFDALNENFLKKERFDEFKKVLLKIKKRKSGEKEIVVNWIAEGLELHKEDHHKCKFCSQSIEQSFWDERLKKIREILEKDIEFEQLENEIKDNIALIDRKIEFIDRFNLNLVKDQFLTQYQDQANTILSTVKDRELKLKYRNSLQKIKSLFEDKLKMIDELVFLGDESFEISYFLELQKLNMIIKDNNKECKELNLIKENARNQVIDAILHPHIDEIKKFKDYSSKVDRFIPLIKSRIENHQSKLEEVEKELNNQTVATKEIEDICEQVFGYKKFSFMFDDSIKSYRIVRTGTSSARNISEGEKTVIAFAYFVACLKENNFQRNEGIVVIDDPISSLDQQYLFNLYIVMMREVLKETLCCQAFILTHNFYFFRKIRNCIKNASKLKDPEKKRDFNNISVSIYSVEKVDGKSHIQDATKYLLNYESEYLHLVRKLNKDLSDASDEFSDVGVGNAIRQVLEIFLSFKCPDENSFYTRFHNIDPKPDKKFKYLYDLANSMSHTDEIDTEVITTEYKKTAGKVEIKELFDFIENVDDKHYAKLKKVL